jgi:hypothetical protein
LRSFDVSAGAGPAIVVIESRKVFTWLGSVALLVVVVSFG